jgi:ribosomal subunit interface protein
MQIIVSGKNIEIGDAIRKYADDHLEPCIGKYFEQAVRAHVTLSKDRHLFSCDILVNEGTGRKVSIRAHAEESDPYASFGECLKKVEKQLRRYKRKLTKTHRRKESDMQAADVLVARQYVLAREEEDGADERLHEAPAIIAEGTADIEEMTVGEAVMRMDLQDLHAFMFVNSKNGHISLVHRRQDGNVAWLDSNTLAAAGAAPQAAAHG